ncbi:unnamed protein product [Ixodes pacificus]
MHITMLPSLFTTKLVSEPFDHISYMQRNAFKLLHSIQKERQNRGLVTKQLNFIFNVLCDQSRSSYATCMHNRGPVSVPRKYHPPWGAMLHAVKTFWMRHSCRNQAMPWRRSPFFSLTCIGWNEKFKFI